MKRYKVKITDKNSFYHEYPDGSAFGGSYGEPIVVNLRLNKAEFDALTLFMRQIGDLRHDIALFNFTQCVALTPWHKRVMCENFKAITPERVTIEFL